MSLTYDQSLKILEVGAEASDEALETAYRDLVRVWHPDRFTNNDRLRAKAEDHTKRINEAIEVVRRVRATGIQKGGTVTSTTPNESNCPPTPNNDGRQRAQTCSEPQYPPLFVYQTIRSSLARSVAASCALLIGYSVLTTIPYAPYENSFGMLVALAALYSLMNDLTLLLGALPVLCLHQRGLFIFPSLHLCWSAVGTLSSRVDYRTICLYLEVDQAHVTKQSKLKQFALWLRKRVRNAHYILPFTGLSEHPATAVNAARAFLAYARPTPPEPKNSIRTITNGLWWMQMLSGSLAVAWWQFGYDPQLIECAPYCVIFIICHLGRLTLARRELARALKRD